MCSEFKVTHNFLVRMWLFPSDPVVEEHVSSLQVHLGENPIHHFALRRGDTVRGDIEG